MKTRTKLLAVGFFLVLLSASKGFAKKPDNFKAWIAGQNQRSLELLLANISPYGAARGAVVASPSRQNPNYFFHWTRDAALVMNVLMDFHENSQGNANLELHKLLVDYLHFSRSNQLTPNPSAAFHSSGLGEPKFNADGSAYTDGWPRPQNDGPALRVIVLSRWTQKLLNEQASPSLIHQLYEAKLPANSVIKADLEFLKDAWAHSGFDLWEECRGHHFYTRLVQYKALLDGADLAERMNDPLAASEYRKAAGALRYALYDHWDSNRGYVLESFGEGCRDRNTGMDIGTVLGVNHTQGTNSPLRASDDRILATVIELERAFQAEYPINNIRQDFYGNTMAPGTGRYPGDKYNGYNTEGHGNPWVLSTNAMAELYYRAIYDFAAQGNLSINDINWKFFQALVPNEKLPRGTFSKDSEVFKKLVSKMFARADQFVYRVRHHGFGNGSFSEQFNRDNGRMQGAEDLTWNYASFLSMFGVRQAIDP